MTLVLHHLQWKTLVSDHLHDLEIESVPAPVHLLWLESQDQDNQAISY